MVSRRRRCTTLLRGTLLLLISCSANAQRISTNTQVPPLQWINITGHLTGPAAPPLKDASIGYDEDTRSIVIFGGESQQSFPQSQTYILNLATLVWSQPTGGSTQPPARTRAISGDDFAASYRRGHVVIGGLGNGGTPLSDVWEYNYAYQYWTSVAVSPGGPSARYGAVGGIDTRTQSTSDPLLSTPNNTLYLAGGIDTSSVYSLSDAWRFNVSGTLSPNVPGGVVGSWEQVSISSTNVPTKVGASGAVVSQSVEDIIAIGGCTTSTASSPPCAGGDSYIINTQAGNVQAPAACAAPRLDGTVVANLNENSSSFGSQVFLLLGTVNASLWDDSGGLQRGEVDILDINTGAWARILPAGDPGTNNLQTFPAPRQGAAAISFAQTLVGSQRSIGSDTLVFGGQDASGQYLSDVWILRAYNGSISQTNQTWSGFGDGTLQSGINANGAGVTVQFMTQCASAISGQATQTSGSPTPTMSGSPSTTTHSSYPTFTYNTSVVHKAFSPISVALCFPAVVFLRLALPSADTSQAMTGRIVLLYSSIVIGIAAYGLGIAGMATSFSSISSAAPMVLARRSSSSSSAVLRTAHGRAGLAFFIGFYGLVPLLFAISACHKHFVDKKKEYPGKVNGEKRPRANSSATAEKPASGNGRTSSPEQSVNGLQDAPESRRVRSWSGWPGFGARRSSDSGFESTGASAPSQRSFEVVNRPTRARRASGNSLAAFSDPRIGSTPRNLSDMSWFDGRRSLNAVGGDDVALNNLGRRGPDPPTPGTTAMDMRSTSGLMSPITSSVALPEMPPVLDRFLHIFFHAFLLGLAVISLVALWFRAPLATFVVFLVATVLFYIALVILAWYGRPKESMLSVVVHRLFSAHLPPNPAAAIAHRLSADGSEAIPFPTVTRGPYQHHHPPYRTTMSIGLDEYPTSVSHGHGTAEFDDDDDGEDEDTRQRRIEEEMSRRDVSIVTVPKRKLFLTNPEQR